MKRALLLLLLVSCSPSVRFDNGSSFVVEVADSPEEHMQGLMFRDSMPDNHGMLFVFEDVSPRTFWMKDTLIPLDMIFVDENMSVVEIKSNVLPCEEDPCKQYTSEPAKYVFEINSGLAEKNGIKVGSVLSK